MNCPGCGTPNSGVYKTQDDGVTASRQRRCKCGGRWYTDERVRRGSFVVISESLLVTGGSLVTANSPPVTSPQNSCSGSDLPSSPLSNPDQTQAPVEPEDPVVFGGFVLTGGSTWDLRASVDAPFAKAFPALDRQAEYAKAAAWLIASAANRKTAKGMPRFLLGWLGRAQNAARTPSAAQRRDNRCAFHLNWNNHHRKPPGGWYANCPECKEAQAAAGTRQGEPTAAADALAATERKVRELRDAAGKTWTPDQLAEMRATRAQKIREPAEPRPPPLNAPTAASPAVHPGGSSVDGSGTPAGYPGVVSKGGS